MRRFAPTGRVWSNWCKVPALLDAFERHVRARHLFWLDSDALVWDHARPLPAYLKGAHLADVRAPGGAGGCKPTRRRALDRPVPALLLWNNHPWGCGFGCTGTLVVQRVPSALRALRAWWDYAGEPVPSADQGAFNAHVLHAAATANNASAGEDAGEEVAALLADSPTNLSAAAGQFVLHRCSSCGWLPPHADVWQRAIARNGLDNRTVRAAMRDVVSGVILLDRL